LSTTCRAVIDSVTDDLNEACPCVQEVDVAGDRTWTVLGSDFLPVAPVEEWWLEYLRRVDGASPHTVRSYATALAQWWQLLELMGVAWDAADLVTLGAFKAFLRTGRPPAVVALGGDGPSTANRRPAPTGQVATLKAMLDAAARDKTDLQRRNEQLTKRPAAAHGELLELRRRVTNPN
jgi:hypothetical protein